jgi:hypothetical protein
LTLIKLKEIYEMLESAIDRCEDVATSSRESPSSTWVERTMSTMVIAGILLALLFDFLNGMNDAPIPSPPWSPPGCCRLWSR